MPKKSTRTSVRNLPARRPAMVVPPASSGGGHFVSDGSVNRRRPTDPPLLPMDQSVKWIESDANAILSDVDLATLIIRLGMASNALDAQLSVHQRARHQPPVVRLRDTALSLVTEAALTFEAIKVLSSGMARLRPLASQAGASEELLKRVGRLCAGQHAASAFLERARNQLGFHWDAEAVRLAVLMFGRTEKLVWIEFDGNGEAVHRLAVEVMIHAMFPELATNAIVDEATVAPLLDTALRDMQDASTLVTEFTVKATLGFLLSVTGSGSEPQVPISGGR